MKTKTKKPIVQKKASNKTKHISFLLDATGSMLGTKEKTINDFNEYIQSIKNFKGIFTLTQFNSAKIDIVYTKPIKEVPAITTHTYLPDASTPLYDAIGKTIKALEADEGKQDLLMVILTDGQENASKEYDKKGITTLMKEKEKKGWTFVYLGVGQAAWDEGHKMGMTNFASTTTANRAMHIGSGASMAFFSGGQSATKTYMNKTRK